MNHSRCPTLTDPVVGSVYRVKNTPSQLVEVVAIYHSAGATYVRLSNLATGRKSASIIAAFRLRPLRFEWVRARVDEAKVDQNRAEQQTKEQT